MKFNVIRLRRNASINDAMGLFQDRNVYLIHQSIWNMFSDGPNRQRDFLYRYESVRGRPTFYTVSQREPSDTSGLWEIQSKEYTPKVSKGERLGFSLRVNPICSKRDENDRHHRHDVVMEAKTRLGYKALPPEQRPYIADLVQQAGFVWLKSRETNLGFVIDEGEQKPAVRVDGYFQHRLFKGKGTKPITFSTLDLNGVLTVADPERFVEKSLYEGIGPAKGFGCGLMLVRRIR
jgi:CRISPR system Cascade subunit CasE